MTRGGRDVSGLLPVQLIGRLGAVLYLGSSFVAIVTLPLPQAPDASRPPQLVVAVVALLAGAFSWYAPWERWQRRATLWLVPLALGLIGAGNAFAGAPSMGYGIFFVVVFVWIGIAHPRWTATLFAPLAAVAYMVPLFFIPGDRGLNMASGALTILVCALVGETLAWVAARFRRSQEDLHDAEMKYRALVEQVPALIYIQAADDVGTPLYVSPQAPRLLGHTQEKFADPALWVDQLHPQDRDRFLRERSRTNSSGARFQMEYQIRAADGRYLWVRDEALVVRDGEGKPLFRQGIVVDITERKRAEFQRLSLLSKLVSAQEEERRRIAGAIHDDPVQVMTAAGMRLQILQRSTSDPRQIQALRRLEEIVDRAVQRLRHLMFELRPYALDRDGLAGALRMYVDMQSREEDSPSYSLVSQLKTEPPPADRLVLYRIAQEVLTNARKHARASRVAIVLEERNGYYVVQISDDGVGFTSDETPDSPPGHLGLAAITEMAESAGGRCRLTASVGRGTLVEVAIPVRHGPSEGATPAEVPRRKEWPKAVPA